MPENLSRLILMSSCIESPDKGTSVRRVCGKHSLRCAPRSRNSNENFGCCRQRFQVIGGSSDPDRDVTCLDIVSGHCDAGRRRHSKSYVDSVCYDQSRQCSSSSLLVVVMRSRRRLSLFAVSASTE